VSTVTTEAEVRMPRLSDSMEEGVLLRWAVPSGSTVDRGDNIAEVETDKAVMPFDAEDSGVLHTLVEEGDTVSVGELIAYILPPGAEAPNALPETPAAAPAPATTSVPGGEPPAPSSADRVNASPVARRIAAELGVGLHGLTGSGPRGRVVKADVLRAGVPRAGEDPVSAPAQPAVAVAEPSEPTPQPTVRETQPSGAKGEVQVIEPSRLQRTIARRMTEAKATAPDFTLEVDVDMTRAVAERRRFKALLGEKPAPSLNDFIVKAVAVSLRDHPKVNGAFRNDTFELYERVNVGVAVAAPDALVVPVVTQADTRSLGSIADEVRRLAAAARNGSLTAADLDGGTFSVSNLGMFGVSRFTAVLNPPQAAILAVGAATERAVVRDGELAVATVASLTLTCDHRIVHGADGAAFLATLRAHLEQPELLVL
jgi:pyruvate dehydrogenase E2 component (dihydrolipoamide acetyltransferase)